MKKTRLDAAMMERGLAESRTLAQKLVMAGQVRINGSLAMKASDTISEEDEIGVDLGPKYVSRGGEKLEAALQEFLLCNLPDKICADLGASTGGFTDCLLQHGARKVYAVDVGQGILHWKLRNDPRVIVLEKTNARYLDQLPEKVDLVTVDVSFISTLVILPVVQRILVQGSGYGIILIKPQFEAGREAAARGKGVIRDPEIHQQVLHKVILAAGQNGFSVQGLIPSPIIGPKGNREFLLFLQNFNQGVIDEEELIRAALQKQGKPTEK